MHLQKKISIMQPYLFPYIGYFHLIQASDLIVFYDDVDYMPRGWVNRNKILLHGGGGLFTVPVARASQNIPINETAVLIDQRWKKKFRTKLFHAYGKAPCFAPVEELVMSVFSGEAGSVGDLAIKSICRVYEYLGMRFDYTKSSVCSPETRGAGRAERLIEISKSQGGGTYVNAPGGKNLYQKAHFEAHGVGLAFVDSEVIQYRQYAGSFVPALSIIDVLMFNDIGSVKTLLAKYKLC